MMRHICFKGCDPACMLKPRAPLFVEKSDRLVNDGLTRYAPYVAMFIWRKNRRCGMC